MADNITSSDGHIGSGLVEAAETQDWTPVVLGDDVIAWWDVLDAIGIFREGDAIMVISDRSGNGNELYQHQHEFQPNWVEHTINNSFEAAVFDGVNDQMVSDFSIEQPFTVVQLIRTGDTLEPFASSFQGSAEDALIYLRNEDLGDEVAIGATDAIATGISLELNTNYIIVSSFDDADAYVSINGEVALTPDIGTAGVTAHPRV